MRQVQPGPHDQIQEIQGIALSDFTSMPVQTDKIAHARDTNKWHCNKMHTSLRPGDFFNLISFQIFKRGAPAMIIGVVKPYMDGHTFLFKFGQVHLKFQNSSYFYEHLGNFFLMILSMKKHENFAEVNIKY